MVSTICIYHAGELCCLHQAIGEDTKVDLLDLYDGKVSIDDRETPGLRNNSGVLLSNKANFE